MSGTVKTIIGIIIIIIIVVLVIIFGGRGEKHEGAIKIGVLADLSGDYASFLEGIPQGIEFALEDLEKEIDNEIITIVEDQKSCDIKETVTIMNKFLNVDKVDLVIGGTCSSTTLAAAPLANQSKTIMISAGSSAPSVSQAGEYVFRTYASDSLKAKEAGNLAYQLGYRKMAIVTEITNDYSIELTKGAKESFISNGGEIVIEESISSKDTDFRTQLTKVKSKNPDVLLISITGPNQIALIAKQVSELGMDIQIMHPAETPEHPEVVKVAGEAVEGLIYIMPGNPPESEKYQDLATRYKEKYNETHPPYFTEAYDAVMLGVKAVLASDGTKEDVREELFKVSKVYDGISGNVEFDENGDVTKPILVKQIKDGKFVVFEK